MRQNSGWGWEDTLVCTPPTDQHSSPGWVILAVIVSLVLLAGLAFWLRKSWWVLYVWPSPPVPTCLPTCFSLSPLILLLPAPFPLAPHFSPPPHVEWLQSLFSSGLAVNLQTHFSLWNEIPTAQEPRTHLNRTRWWGSFHSLCTTSLDAAFFLLNDQLLI